MSSPESESILYRRGRDDRPDRVVVGPGRRGGGPRPVRPQSPSSSLSLGTTSSGASSYSLSLSFFARPLPLALRDGITGPSSLSSSDAGASVTGLTGDVDSTVAISTSSPFVSAGASTNTSWPFVSTGGGAGGGNGDGPRGNGDGPRLTGCSSPYPPRSSDDDGLFGSA